MTKMNVFLNWIDKYLTISTNLSTQLFFYVLGSFLIILDIALSTVFHFAYILLLFSSRWEQNNQILNVRDILSKSIKTIFGFNTVENFKILPVTSWSNKSKFHEGNCYGKEIEALCYLWWTEIKVLMLRSLWLEEIKNGIFFSCHCTHWGSDLFNLYFLHEGQGWCKQSFSWWLWNM